MVLGVAELVEVGVVESGNQNFVKAIVGVLEGTGEESDTSAVNLVKASGGVVNKRHVQGLQENKG